MWYRHAQAVQPNSGAFDRQTLDMTGGVKSHQDSDESAENEQIEPNLEAISTNQPENINEADAELDVSPNNQPSEDVFTDYTPPSSADEDNVEQMQDLYRAQDLEAILSGASVALPMHDSCRCRIQFRPDDNSDELLVPRWEVSPSACPDCIRAQQSFNQYVEQSGVRVQPPENAAV